VIFIVLFNHYDVVQTHLYPVSVSKCRPLQLPT
jgi:hypothetical protein